MEREKCVEIGKGLICRSCGHGGQSSSTCYLWFGGPDVHWNAVQTSPIQHAEEAVPVKAQERINCKGCAVIKVWKNLDSEKDHRGKYESPKTQPWSPGTQLIDACPPLTAMVTTVPAPRALESWAVARKEEFASKEAGCSCARIVQQHRENDHLLIKNVKILLQFNIWFNPNCSNSSTK